VAVDRYEDVRIGPSGPGFRGAHGDAAQIFDEVDNSKRLHSALRYHSPVKFEEEHTRQMVKPAA
jgi:putative transposase